MPSIESSSLTVAPDFGELEEHRRALTGYCYRMLGSPFEAEDAVQDTLLRAWRNLERFEGRAVGIGVLQQPADAGAEPGQVCAHDRAADGKGDRLRG